MSICFPNTLEGTALEFFHAHLSMDAPFPKIVQVMSHQFNSEHRQQQLLSQMQAAKLEKFMKERKHDSLSDGLDALVAGLIALYLNSLMGSTLNDIS